MASGRPSRRLGPAALSVAGHLALLVAIVLVRPPAPPTEPQVITVALVAPLVVPPPEPKAANEAPAAPKAAQAKPKREPQKRKAAKPPGPAARPAKAPPTVAPLAARDTPAVDAAAGVSDAELAAAATADSGGGGGGAGCNMARWLQSRLRADPRVQAAAAQAAHGRAIRVWNGAWVRQGGEDGAGLAAVREAIMWHVAFAPEACRAQAVHGLVLISLDGAGGTRLVMGTGEWRWSDLLHARSRTSG